MNLINNRKYLILALLLFLMASFSRHAFAGDGQGDYIYERMNMKNLSLLYWALDKLDIENNTHIDNFMRINECDIYKDYISHDFSWREIRKSSREFIEENKRQFPLRFEFSQALKVMDYDFEKEGFEFADEYKIEPTRRFEVLAMDGRSTMCGNRKPNMEGYTRGVVVEFSRPFGLDFLPVEPDTADKYITERMAYFKALPLHRRTTKDLYSTRNVYLVMKVKFFSYIGERRTSEGFNLAHVLAVLEGYDVYGDAERNLLLYSESYRSRKKKTLMERKLIKQYEESKKRQSKESPEPDKDEVKEKAGEVKENVEVQESVEVIEVQEAVEVEEPPAEN
ncbi:MAG: hypothetical protein DHS20C02_05280 [Micavibrio sp.]|nr:MAG: hypothetical protein DHS20C02_05280 [Micavibrio sp.]